MRSPRLPSSFKMPYFYGKGGEEERELGRREGERKEGRERIGPFREFLDPPLSLPSNA